MANFLLIHGSCHGAWCWRDVIPALKTLGHEARAIDLPSHGGDTTPPGEVTLALYAKAICDAMSEPTILVGHSAGGYAIAAAAERDPSNIARLVYLAAYIPRDGKSLVDLRFEADEQPLKGALDMAADKVSYRFRPDRLEDILYPDCPRGTVDYARALVDWQAIKPQATALSLTTASQDLPKSAIITSKDGCIPPAHLRQMAAGIAANDTYEIDTGHSPFFAAPETLAAMLAALSDAT